MGLLCCAVCKQTGYLVTCVPDCKPGLYKYVEPRGTEVFLKEVFFQRGMYPQYVVSQFER